MLYNNETLQAFCFDNNINLLEDYTNVKLNRDNYIKGVCVSNDCVEPFDKNFRQLIKTGAYCHNCTIENGKQKHKLKCKYNYDALKLHCDENNITLNSVYNNVFINRDTIIYGKCIQLNCENDFHRPFRELIKFNGYCENCSKESGKIKMKETNLQKYGVVHPMKNAEFKEKCNQIILEKYGVKHISQSDKIKEQKKATSIEKYGVEFVLQSEIVKNKSKSTNLERYGVENPQQNKIIKDKTMETNLQKYGCKSAAGNLEIRQKMTQTSLEKYGVPHHSQNAEVSERMFKASYKLKQYTLPSGKILNYQGYENFALDLLLNEEHIVEENIITQRTDVPEIWYIDKTNKKRRHFVDFYITSQNRCIEVKSSWTNQEKNNVFEKQDAAIKLGYKYDIWIFDKKGNKVAQY
jgi:hypothetical protein